MSPDVVTKTVGSLLVPFVLIFGLYVTWHGEGGPGGGFQGGVIVAAGFVLFALIHGTAALRRVLSRTVTLALTAVGVLVYAGVGLIGMARGGAFLDYGRLIPSDPVAGQALGITLVEFGVAIAVFAVMLTIFEELGGD